MAGLERINGHNLQGSRNGKDVLGSPDTQFSHAVIGGLSKKRSIWEAMSPNYLDADGMGEDNPELVNPHLVRSRFPKNIDDFRRRLKDVGPFDRAISFLDLGVDMGRAFWAEVEIGSRVGSKRFMDGEEHLRGGATLIFGQGLGSLYGSDFFKAAAPWAKNMITHGTYVHPIQYWEGMGFDVESVQTHPIFNTGDIDKNVGDMKKKVVRAKEESDAPVYCIVHSVDALCAQVFMAEYPDLAREVDGFILGAGPLPERINPWIGDAFLALGEREDSFPYIEKVLDFYLSGGARRVNIISMKDTPDRILDGWPGGRLVDVDGGHSAVFHKLENLRTVVNIVNETSFPQVHQAA